jgi:hypothetical protein
MNSRSFGAPVLGSRSTIRGHEILSKNSDIFTQFVVIVTVTSISSPSSSSQPFLSLYNFVGLFIFLVFVNELYFSTLYIDMNAKFSSFNLSMYCHTNGFLIYTLEASEAFCACSVVSIWLESSTIVLISDLSISHDSNFFK